jgi:hypothetical protein
MRRGTAGARGRQEDVWVQGRNSMAALFSTFSLIIACLVKTRERFMGIGQVLTMPMFFASNAIYPIEMMPSWLKAVAWCNPLPYEVDPLRALMLANGASEFGLAVDFVVLIGTTGTRNTPDPDRTCFTAHFIADITVKNRPILISNMRSFLGKFRISLRLRIF